MYLRDMQVKNEKAVLQFGLSLALSCLLYLAEQGTMLTTADGIPNIGDCSEM
ncbi:MAG: hypothetical protein K2N24_03615 [Lachnospiraceae bacterium]|nr:hypothetical protein [Lachnospiraceae bacterium]